MGRSSRDQRGQFSTMVRYDGRGRIIPGSNILKKDKSLTKVDGKRKMLTSVVILYLRHLLFQQYHGYKHKVFQN